MYAQQGLGRARWRPGPWVCPRPSSPPSSPPALRTRRAGGDAPWWSSAWAWRCPGSCCRCSWPTA
ncbi:hypothetical protein QJS66_08780 [Kocuria rhizophila]|nr:hypothetical protein QJS66_08780 [Kocuria rhizophila]